MTCLRAIIDSEHCELAGLYVYNPAKVGKDAGEITRRDTTGVLAVNDIAAIEAIDADVVIHAARLGGKHEAHDDDIARLLASGKNVISINGNTFAPQWPEARREKILNACQQGNSSFMGAGLNPGLAAEQLLIAASGACLSVDSASLSEVVHTAEMRSPEYVFDILAFGSAIGSVDMNGDSWPPAATLNGLFEDVIAGIAHRFNWPLDGIVRAHRMLPAGQDLEIKAGTIKKGTASHIDWRWCGVVNGEEKIFLDIAWAMSDEHIEDDSDALWKLRLSGVPNVELDYKLERPADYPGRTSVEQIGLAGAVLNAIPYVVEHAPGFALIEGILPFKQH